MHIVVNIGSFITPHVYNVPIKRVCGDQVTRDHKNLAQSHQPVIITMMKQ